MVKNKCKQRFKCRNIKPCIGTEIKAVCVSPKGVKLYNYQSSESVQLPDVV